MTVGAADRRDHVGVDVAVEGEEARPLELHRERRERVGEDVVELPRDPAALVERRRLVARQPRPLLLLEQCLRLDLVVLGEPQQVSDHEHEDVGDVGPGEDEEAFARRARMPMSTIAMIGMIAASANRFGSRITAEATAA